MQTKARAPQQIIFDQELSQDFERPVMPDESPALREELVDGVPVDRLLNTDAIEAFEQAVTMHKRMLTAIFQLTTPTHWVNMGSKDQPKLYLQGPGVEALMKPLRIAYERPEIRKELKQDDGGEYYAYWVEGFVESKLLQQTGLFFGYCDSRDQFFNARRDWNPSTGEGDVKKSAMTNWLVNAVTRLAGIRNPDIELIKAAGIDIARIPGVNFSGQKTAEEGTKLISEAQQKRLWGIAKSKSVESALLRVLLKEVYGLDGSDKITKDRYDGIIKLIESGPTAIQEHIEQARAKRAQDSASDEGGREPGEDDA